MPYTSNPRTFDVVLGVGGLNVFIHINNRATAAGAVGPAMGMLKGKERQQLHSVKVQPCDGSEECWVAGPT